MAEKDTFEYVTRQLGRVTPATMDIARELFSEAKKAGHAPWHMWGMGGGKEHGSGRALDLMVHNRADGDWIRDYLWKHRERLRLRHVIWAQHITSTLVQPGVRRRMADRGNSTENHYDHNHVWFNEGAYRPPGTTAPAPAPTKGLTMADIADIMTALEAIQHRADAIDVEADRRYGVDAARYQDLVNRLARLEATVKECAKHG